MKQQHLKLMRINYFIATKEDLNQEEGCEFNSKWFLQRCFTTITNGICCRSSKISWISLEGSVG